MSRTTIVIPCYNEAQRLPWRAVLEFCHRFPSIELCCVNDGSTDGTAELLDRLADQSAGRIRVEHLVENRGKAEAVRQGMQRAIAAGADHVGYWDADLATPLEVIPQFQAVLDRRAEIDLVIASRLSLLGHRIDRRPWRRACGRVFAAAASWTLGFGIRDTQCGAKLFRSTPTLNRALQSPFRSRWIFDVELLVRLYPAGDPASARSPRRSIYEYPLESWQDVAGSKLRIKDFTRAGFEMVGIFSRDRLSRVTQAFRPRPALPSTEHSPAEALPLESAPLSIPPPVTSERVSAHEQKRAA